MRRLDRHVITEILGPFGIGFLIYTSILLIQLLFRSADFIIKRDVPAAQVGELVLYSLPNILVITVPMALLFGVLVAVARLSADSEITAMRACGQSLYSLLRPILYLCGAVTILSVLLMTLVLPWGNSEVVRLRGDIISRSFAGMVEPRVFFEEWRGVLLYIFDTEPGDDAWSGIFMATEQPDGEHKLHVADSGTVAYDERGESIVLNLQNAITHVVRFPDPADYEVTTNVNLRERIEDPDAVNEQKRYRVRKGVRSLTISELRAQLDDEALPEVLRNLTRVELHKKFSFPASCLVFGILGVVLGFSRQRGGGRATGFAVSIGVILIFYVLIKNGEEAAGAGQIPAWLSMWLPNLALGSVGLALLVRRNKDKPLLGPLDRWIRTTGWRIVPWLKRFFGLRKRKPRQADPQATAAAVATRPAGSTGTKDVVLRLPTLRRRLLSRLDRYVIRRFFSAFVLILLSTLVVFGIADLTEKADSFINNDVPPDVIVDYYKYVSFQNTYDLAPFVVLITTLVVFGLLSRNNEVIAAKASGVSVYRLAAPALLASLAVVGLLAFLEAKVLPSSNQRVAMLEDRIHGKKVVRSYRRADHNWLYGQGRYIYNYLHYDPGEQALHRLQVFEFDDDNRLVRRLFANKATYVGDGWRFDDAWTRTFDGRETVSYQRYSEPVLGDFPETPEYFESEFRHPEALSYAELRDHIGEIESSGQKVPDLRVALAKKLGFPAICFVMALVALPFSFRLGRRGALYGVGIGISLGMVFLGAYAFSTMLGETGTLPPVVAVWSPSFAFVLLALYGFLGVET